MLAWQRSGTRYAGPPPAENLPQEPVPFPSLPRLLRTVDAAGGSFDEARTVELRVRVNGSPRSGAPLGVAVLDGRNGQPLGYQTVDLDGLPVELTFADIPEGRQLVCLAQSPRLSANNYLDRVAVSGEGAVAEVTLSARVQDVRIQLSCPDDPTLVANTLHQLVRVDDPNWRPPQPVPAGVLQDPMLMTDASGILELKGLGPGQYRLVLLGLVPEERLQPETFEFRVPGPNQLEIICRRR